MSVADFNAWLARHYPGGVTPAPRPRGLSGFIQIVEEHLSGVAPQPEIARRILAKGGDPGRLIYRQTGADVVSTVARGVGIAFSPLAAAPAFGGANVSLLDTISGLANVATSVGQAIQAFQRPRITAPAPAFTGGLMQTAFPLAPMVGGGLIRSLPALGSLGAGAIVGAGTRVAIAGGRRLFASAASYCRRNPGWCASIGGIAAVEGLIRSGQLPPVRARRGRGISSKEFRSFRRVHKVLSGFCAPKMSIRRKKR